LIDVKSRIKAKKIANRKTVHCLPRKVDECPSEKNIRGGKQHAIVKTSRKLVVLSQAAAVSCSGESVLSRPPAGAHSCLARNGRNRACLHGHLAGRVVVDEKMKSDPIHRSSQRGPNEVYPLPVGTLKTECARRKTVSQLHIHGRDTSGKIAMSGTE
jgi:hypothetical protein